MGWVKDAIKELKENGVCKIRPIGGSMRGRIESGQLVTINKADASDCSEGDVVFVKWKNNYLLHLIVELTEDEVLIGNNIGKVNGWVPNDSIIGKVTKVED